MHTTRRCLLQTTAAVAALGAGIAATYVGHPLADAIDEHVDAAAARAGLGLAPDAAVVALLPGSRRSEIQYIARPFFEAAALVLKARPAIKLIVPAVPALRDRIEQVAGSGHYIQRERPEASSWASSPTSSSATPNDPTPQPPCASKSPSSARRTAIARPILYPLGSGQAEEIALAAGLR